MDTKKYETLKLKDIMSEFCGNPTPFKLIDVLNEEDSVSHALNVLENSDSKRKVIGIKNSSEQIIHLGYNELIVILKNLE